MFLNKKIIDLTLELRPGESTWVNLHPPFTMIDYHQNWVNKADYPPDSPIEYSGFSTKFIAMTDHTGTHMDAKRHFHPDGETIEMYDIETFMGEALYLDLSNRNWDDEITVEIFEKALARIDDEIKKNDIIVVRAWRHERDQRFADSACLNKDSSWYLINKEIKMFCTDLATVDNSDLEMHGHFYMLQKNILMVENLVNLDLLKEGRFHFMALPLKIKGGTGSPVRAIAFVDE